MQTTSLLLLNNVNVENCFSSKVPIAPKIPCYLKYCCGCKQNDLQLEHFYMNVSFIQETELAKKDIQKNSGDF